MIDLALHQVPLGDAGGPALVGGFFVFLSLVFIGLGFVVGLVVFLIARNRARTRLLREQQQPPRPR